jgi:hypothetical protein
MRTGLRLPLPHVQREKKRKRSVKNIYDVEIISEQAFF